MAKVNYITDNGYGASKLDSSRGYSDESMKDDMEGTDADWAKRYNEEMQIRNIGFGRETGEAR